MWVIGCFSGYNPTSNSQWPIGLLINSLLGFFGPFQILERIGEVTYKLDLPAGSVIHLVFHVSYLKTKLGKHNVSMSLPPSVNSQGFLTLEPVAVLQTRSHKLRNRTITQHLIQWQGGTVDDATWGDLFHLQQQFPYLVGKLF